MMRISGDSGDWVTLRNPLGSDHLKKFPLELLLLDEPEYPGVKIFARFTVGQLVKPETKASSDR